MAAGLAWVLNLDADVELAAGPRYAPTRVVRAAMAPQIERLAGMLLGPDDVLVDDASPPGSAAGRVGHAFCPTSRAVATLIRAGASPAPHPTHAVLREANSRAFCIGLGQTLPGGELVSDLARAEELVSAVPPIAQQWRAKRLFGMAGRGQRPIAVGVLSEGDRAFLRSAIGSDGGIVIEPDVAIVQELGQHGFVDAAGDVRLGQLVEQVCDAHGQWIETRPAPHVVPATRGALEDEARLVAHALHRAGYFGPFGIDAFHYRDLEGVVRLQPRSEINARYSMGFAIGWGGPPLVQNRSSV